MQRACSEDEDNPPKPRKEQSTSFINLADKAKKTNHFNRKEVMASRTAVIMCWAAIAIFDIC